MTAEAKIDTTRARGSSFALGLNPYGLTYHLGLQGAGGPRANEKGGGLDGFIAIATELAAKTLEIYDPWLRPLSDDALRALKDRLAGLGMTPIVSWGLMMGPFESALRSARVLDAAVIRCGLTTVLCGDRHALGEKWNELVDRIRARTRRLWAARRRRGRTLGDRKPPGFRQPGTRRLLRIRRAASASASTPATPSPWPKRRSTSPAASPRYVRHVHLKDYRVQFTDEGYRLSAARSATARSRCPPCSTRSPRITRR